LADAAIADKRFGEGESIYRKLMIDFPNAPQAGQWALRIGWALFLQDKFQDARDHLMGQIDTIGVPTLQSEAFHWIGESEFALKNYQGAIAALNQALESTQPWDRLDTTLFVRLQSELELGLLGDAKATLEVLKNDYPNSNLTAEAMLRTAEIYFDQQQFAESANQYQTIITQYPNTDFLPSALYGLGWAQLRSDQLAQSESTFDRLIEAFPTTKLSQQARVGRSIAQRRLGKTEQAITDLIAFIESAPAGERKNNSLLELGLAYVQNENWAEAESTFTRLLAIKPKTSFSDRVHYELAWVLQNRNQPDLSLEQFKQLLKNYPASDLAPEAFFEVASDAYQRKQFETAAEFFVRGLSSITNLESAANTSLSNDTPTAKTSDFDSPYVDLKQKTFYQLGWAKYKLKDFPSAASHFQRLTDTFPDAELAADATFMLGQSHFQSDNFQAALSAYQSALDKIKTRNSSSDVVSPQRRLLLLHGAQSANQIGKFATAIELATPLTLIPVSETVGPEIAMQHAAWLEIAKSRLGLEQFDGAKDAFQRAAVDLGRTGAQARVMKADLLLQQNQFQDAINEYKLVFYGYGGTKSTGEIRALQAYAIYETARANYSRIAQASPAMRDQLINDSLKHFDYLIENYSDQPLADDAKQTVAELKLLRQP
jgi:TolA-binding protein